MNVVPIKAALRHYCQTCNTQFLEHERARHANCDGAEFCADCARMVFPGETECPACGCGKHSTQPTQRSNQPGDPTC